MYTIIVQLTLLHEASYLLLLLPEQTSQLLLNTPLPAQEDEHADRDLETRVQISEALSLLMLVYDPKTPFTGRIHAKTHFGKFFIVIFRFFSFLPAKIFPSPPSLLPSLPPPPPSLLSCLNTHWWECSVVTTCSCFLRLSLS